jgi:cytochrome c oxidase subunit 2
MSSTNSLEYLIKHKLLNLPVLASEHGSNIDDLIVYVHALMGALFVGWFGYFLYTLVRFRRSRNPKADYVGVRSHFSNYLEGGVAIVEVILLVGFSIPLWAKVVSNPPAADQATVINVIGRQFNWNGHYAGVDGKMGRQDPTLSTATDPFGVDRKGDPDGADDVVVQGNFVVPVGKDVLVSVGSLDVIHSFAVRAMRVCQDAIPGLRIPTWFKPVREGEYKITCAQLCGNSHYGMFGTLKVVSQAEYDKWLAEQSAKAKGAAAAPVSYE